MKSRCMDPSNSQRWPWTAQMSPTTAVLALNMSKWATPLAGVLSCDEVRKRLASIGCKARRAKIGHNKRVAMI